MFFGILFFDNEPSLACHWHSSVACRKIRHRSHARCLLSSVFYFWQRTVTGVPMAFVLFCWKARRRSHAWCLCSSVSYFLTRNRHWHATGIRPSLVEKYGVDHMHDADVLRYPIFWQRTVTGMPLAFVRSLLKNKASIACTMRTFFGVLFVDKEPAYVLRCPIFDKIPSLACHWHSSVACRKLRQRSHARCLWSSVSHFLTRNRHWHATGIRPSLVEK